MNPRSWTRSAVGFEAARHLEGLPAGHRARRLHGHSFVASLRCDLPAGWAAFPGHEVEALRQALQASAAGLDYRLLNEQLPAPTDEGLARWLQQQLLLRGVPGIRQLGIRSSPQQGVELDAAGQAHVWRRYLLQSAHRLPNVPAGHKCGRMHGHGFEVVLHHAAGTADTGADADLLDEVWAPFHQQLDHACLNDIAGLDNPTSELLASWLWDRIRPRLPGLSTVTVFETGSCGAVYDGQRYRIWKEMTLDSALQLRRAPGDSALRRIHGHTYRLRLHLSAPLHQVLGWTVDFGDVKQVFNPIFQALDHQPLHEITDLVDCDAASIAHWILARARQQLPQLERVDLEETQGCGAIALAGDAEPALPV